MSENTGAIKIDRYDGIHLGVPTPAFVDSVAWAMKNLCGEKYSGLGENGITGFVQSTPEDHAEIVRAWEEATEQERERWRAIAQVVVSMIWQAHGARVTIVRESAVNP